MEIQNTIRRYDLDWMRALVICMLVPFHTAVMFDVGSTFYVKNVESSRFLAAFTDFLGAWGMQLLFFIAGAACWFALQKYSWKQLISERLLRLLVPLVVCTVTLIPVMGYFGYLYHSDKQVTFFEYVPRFFTFNASDYSGYAGYFSPGHLWFVLFLFVLTLFALPIFIWLKDSKGLRLMGRITTFLSKPGAIFLVPIILYLFDGMPEVAERNITSFFILLIIGFIWMSNHRLQENIDRQKYFILVVSVCLGVVYTALQKWGEQQIGFSLGASIFDLLHDAYLWTVILAFLGIGHSFLNQPTRTVSYVSKASYPFYIIHLPFVVGIGYYVTQWQAGIAVKFMVIAIGSIVGALIAYDLIIRRVRVIGRFFKINAVVK